MHIFKKTDNIKELELLVTMGDFYSEIAKRGKSFLLSNSCTINPKKITEEDTKLLQELISFDIKSYKDHISRRTYAFCLKLRNGFRDELYSEITLFSSINEGVDVSKIKGLIDNYKGIKNAKTTAFKRQLEKAMRVYRKKSNDYTTTDLYKKFSKRRHS